MRGLRYLKTWLHGSLSYPSCLGCERNAVAMRKTPFRAEMKSGLRPPLSLTPPPSPCLRHTPYSNCNMARAAVSKNLSLAELSVSKGVTGGSAILSHDENAEILAVKADKRAPLELGSLAASPPLSRVSSPEIRNRQLAFESESYATSSPRPGNLKDRHCESLEPPDRSAKVQRDTSIRQSAQAVDHCALQHISPISTRRVYPIYVQDANTPFFSLHSKGDVQAGLVSHVNTAGRLVTSL